MLGRKGKTLLKSPDMTAMVQGPVLTIEKRRDGALWSWCRGNPGYNYTLGSDRSVSAGSGCPTVHCNSIHSLYTHCSQDLAVTVILTVSLSLFRNLSAYLMKAIGQECFPNVQIHCRISAENYMKASCPCQSMNVQFNCISAVWLSHYHNLIYRL